MADEGNDVMGLKYPMVDLFTGGLMMPLMYFNALMTWYLLLVTAPWLFMEPWMKGLEGKRDQDEVRSLSHN